MAILHEIYDKLSIPMTANTYYFSKKIEFSYHEAPKNAYLWYFCQKNYDFPKKMKVKVDFYLICGTVVSNH